VGNLPAVHLRFQEIIMPNTAELFGTADPVVVANKMEALKSSLDDSAREQAARRAAGMQYVQQVGWVGGDPAAGALATLEKSVSADVLASVRAELAAGDLTKDISLTSPLASGLVPYDLEAPAKLLFPVLTPLRNLIPRVKGQGLARRYKRITGISGSGTGGVANLSPFINDSSTISSGSLTVRRGPKISYASDEKTINYKQMGASDVVTWSAEFAGQGFTDPRQLSQTALLYASMLSDEKILLAARGTDSGFVGALGTPTAGNVTLTARNAGVGEVGNSANIATLFVRIAAEGMFGEGPSSTEITTTAMSAATGKVIDVTMTGAFPAGATGYRVYVGTVTGIANQFFLGRTGCWGGTAGAGTASFAIQFAGAGTGGTINAGAVSVAADNSASADGFDGILSTQLDPTQSGAIYSVGGKLSTSNLGVEFQNVFAGLFAGGVTGVTGTTAGGSNVKANPDHVWMAGQDRKQLSAGFLASGSGSPTFFFNVPQTDAASMRVGQVITGILNETTGKEVKLEVHPWLPQGTSLVLSESLPTPDSQVPNPFQYALPQDYMAINWPVIQHTYDVSSYWFGALINYAPMFSGAVTNILAG
jgi:hypothetical protein